MLRKGTVIVKGENTSGITEDLDLAFALTNDFMKTLDPPIRINVNETRKMNQTEELYLSNSSYLGKTLIYDFVSL